MRRAPAVVAMLALLVAACTEEPAPIRPTTPPPTPTSTIRNGGRAVFGADQWPECLNPITGCSLSHWTYYAVLQHVLPRAMEIAPDGTYVASPLLREAPALDNGGVDPGPPFTVTFRFSNTAVWDDGSPITSRDLAFTWRSIMNTTGAIRAEGYDRIGSIDATDPAIAIVRFLEPYPDWPELFGGEFGFVLKRAAFPGADPVRPDLKHEMLDAIPFSGGPWSLVSWDHQQAILVRNSRYFGRHSMLDSVTFVPKTDFATQINSLLSGNVAAIHPSGFCPPPASCGVALPYIETASANGSLFVSIWFRLGEPPLDDALVREALMYAIDRQAPLDSLVKLEFPDAEVLGCGFFALPGRGHWCDTMPFDRFRYDPDLARTILASAGYDCSRKICERNGEPLRLKITAGSFDSRLVATQSVLVSGAERAGIALVPRNYETSHTFGPAQACLGPDSVMAVCPYEVGMRPSVTELLSCEAIPSESNLLAGHNAFGWCNREADRLMREADRELDPERRLELMQQVYELEAKDMIGLPLYAIPAVTAWSTERVAGPIGLYNGHPYGPFFNMNEWYVP